LTGAVTTLVAPLRVRRSRRCLVAVLVVGALLGSACSDDDTAASGDGASTTVDEGPNAVTLPTLAGGLDLQEVEPVRVLTGRGLAYGQPLPSQQAAADAYLEAPEVAGVTARQVYAVRDGRLVGEALVLALDGAELFDQGVLDAFVRGVAASVGGDDQEDVKIGGRTTIVSRSEARTTIVYVVGNLVVVVRGAVDADIRNVVKLQLAALAAGVPGAAEPQTPLVPLPIDTAFVPVPTVTFEPIPPPEEEPAPEPPALPGATGVQGRYGVVAGERRTTVWAYTLDPGAYPWAEPLDAALAQLVAARAGGAAAEPVEVLGRVVQRADGAEDVPSARAFRHGGLALVVEGTDPAQLDAVVSAWIAALSAP
jgi:hypothetical protein